MSEVDNVPGVPAPAMAPAAAPATREPAAPESERAFDEALEHGDELNEAQAPETRRAIKRSLGRLAASKAADSAPSNASGQSEHESLPSGGGTERRAADAGKGAESASGDPSGQAARAAPAGVGKAESRESIAGPLEGAPAAPTGQEERVTRVGKLRAEQREAVAGEAPAAPTGQEERVTPVGKGRAEQREAVAGKAPTGPTGQTERVTPAGKGRAEQREAVAGEAPTGPTGQTERVTPVGKGRAEQREAVAGEAAGGASVDGWREGRVASTHIGGPEAREAIEQEGVVRVPADPSPDAPAGAGNRVAPPVPGPLPAADRPLAPTTAGEEIGTTAPVTVPTSGREIPPTLPGGAQRVPNRPERLGSGATGTPPGPVAGTGLPGLPSRANRDDVPIASGPVADVREPNQGMSPVRGEDAQTPTRGPTPSVGEGQPRNAPGRLAPTAHATGVGERTRERQSIPGIAERPRPARVEEEPSPHGSREPDTLDPSAAAQNQQMGEIVAPVPPAPPPSETPAVEPSPTPGVTATAREVVDRILVSVPQSGGSDEVRIGLNASVLDGSSIRIYREAGELRVVFEAPTEASRRFLAENGSVLQDTLAERLPGERVHVGVAAPPSGGMDRDDAEGRSRQQYVPEYTLDSDESDVPNG